MEDFAKIKWSWQTVRTAEECDRHFDLNIDDQESDVFLCHLNEIDYIHLLDPPLNQNHDVHQYLDPRTGKVAQTSAWKQSNAQRGFSNFNQTSKMTASEHQVCLRVVERIAGGQQREMTQTEREDFEKYILLAEKRSVEAREFQEFVKQLFCTAGRQIKLNLTMKEFMEWKIGTDKRMSLKRLEGKNYVLQTAIPINSLGNAKVQLTLEKVVKEKGQIWEYERPKGSLRRNCGFLRNFYESICKKGDILREGECLQTNADVIISSSALDQLIDADNHRQSWSIPFSIKQVGDKKIVSFGEPIAPTNLTEHDQIKEAFKCSLKAVSSNKSPTFVEDTGESIVPKYKVYKFDEYLEKIGPNVAEEWGNYCWNLWNLTDEQQTYKMLVIADQDLRDTAGSFLNLSAKLEFQREFGAEQMTLRELCNEWSQLRFRPNSHTNRVHIDAENGCILSMERIGLHQVEQELNRLHKIAGATLLQPFFNIVKILETFPPSEYVMRHDRKHQEKAMIYRLCDAGTPNAITIASIYQREVSIEDQTIDWIPIDDRIVTAKHRQFQWLPCAFPCKSKKTKKRKGPAQNDRQLIVERANWKQMASQMAAAEKLQRKKSSTKKEKRRRQLERKMKEAKRIKAIAAIEETIDPMEMFDASGNVAIGSMLAAAAMPPPPTPIIEGKLSQMEVDSSPIDYQKYIQEAGLS